jgi:voltage-gated potassium channel
VVKAPAPGSRTWDVLVMALLVGSVAVVFWHASSEDQGLRDVLEWVDIGLCVFFFGEWVWRILQAGGKGRYAATHSWELLGMVPIVAPLPSALRVLRLVRLVRILRVFGSLGRRLGTWERIAKEGSILKIALASGIVTFVGSLLVWLLERDQNPDFVHYTQALWWAVVTVTTVGYGDLTPITAAGRFVAAMLMVTGIGTIGLLASSLASVLVVRKESDALTAAPPGMSGRLVHELQVLVALHDSGKLTDDEFASAKNRLLR